MENIDRRTPTKVEKQLSDRNRFVTPGAIEFGGVTTQFRYDDDDVAAAVSAAAIRDLPTTTHDGVETVRARRRAKRFEM